MTQYGSHVFHRSLVKQYQTAVRAQGVYIYDENGKKYLDGCSGALVSNLGHGNKEIIGGILEQASELAFAHTSQFRNRPIEEYAALISEVAPGDLNYVYFLSGGSEANETAIKMARQYFLEKGQPAKYKIIGRWTSYHGNTLGTLSAGGHAARRKPHAPQLLDFSHIESPDWYRNPTADPIQYANLLETEIKRQDPDQVAAFIFEPITGSSNAASFSPIAYYQRIREICDRYDVLLIADEVMSGFGRTGRYFASDHFGIVPDFITTGKGISGGYSPLAAVIVREGILRAFYEGSGRFLHGHTYCGNPLSTRAGLEVLNYLMKYDVVDYVSEVGELLQSELTKLIDTTPIVGDVRGLGLMIGIEFVANKETKEPLPSNLKISDQIAKACFENGLIVYPGSGHIQGDKGDSILIAPPFIINKEEIHELVEKFYEGIMAVCAKLQQ